MYVCTQTVYRHKHMHTNAHTVQVSILLLQCMVVKKALKIMASMHTYAQCANVHTLMYTNSIQMDTHTDTHTHTHTHTHLSLIHI